MTEEDLEIVKAFLANERIDILNTRAFKRSDTDILITVGSISTEGSKSGVEFQGRTFEVQYGEFAPFLAEMNKYLEKALKYVANENQAAMLQKYIEHYTTGSIDAHKDSQRAWIHDKKPVVESNMGWIETYVDPENARAYYEGWVAIVDKPKSEKF
jgi:dipeptidyl-peptidase-3